MAVIDLRTRAKLGAPTDANALVHVCLTIRGGGRDDELSAVMAPDDALRVLCSLGAFVVDLTEE